MIGTLVVDLTESSRKKINACRPASLDDVHRLPGLIAFSPRMAAEQRELKTFLGHHLYQHARVARMTAKARRIVTDLFQAFTESPKLLPTQYLSPQQPDAARAIADYIAGMTDRYAILEHSRLFEPSERT
jgi:dGTPase